MKLLLDTHTLLWAVSSEKKLSSQARKEIMSSENIVFVSLASLWELKIKESLNKVKLPKNFYKGLQPGGFELLSVTLDHIEYLDKLPPHHRDPFDRMLVSQAKFEQLLLVTRDEEIQKYPVDILPA